jgi:hypothetical protein
LPYTLWSRDRLLGHSDLGYVRDFERHRMGDFFPSELGEKLMPVLTGVTRACADVPQTRELADVAEAVTHVESLELELRGPDGAVIPTEWIGVRDVELVLSEVSEVDEMDDLDEIDPMRADEADMELLRSVQHDMEIIDEMIERNAAASRAAGIPVREEWEEPPYPRYQIQVGLFDDAAVP